MEISYLITFRNCLPSPGAWRHSRALLARGLRPPGAHLQVGGHHGRRGLGVNRFQSTGDQIHARVKLVGQRNVL